MPVINTWSPFAAGINAANDWYKGQQDAKEKALMLARAKELEDQKQSNWQSEQNERRREFGVTEARQNKLVTSEVARNEAEATNKRQVTEHAAKVFPFELKIKELEAQKGKDAHTNAVLEAQIKQLKIQLDKVHLTVAPQVALAGLDLARWRVRHEQATTAHENVETDLAGARIGLVGDERANVQARTALVGTERSNLRAGRTRSGGVPKGKTPKETVEGDFEQLSPAGKKFYGLIIGSPHKRTPGETVNIINSAQASERDKHILRSMMGVPAGRMQMSITDAQDTARTHYGEHQIQVEENQRSKSGGEAMAAIQRAPNWLKVKGQAAALASQILRQGVDVNGLVDICQEIIDKNIQNDKSGLTPAMAKNILDGLH
jgi:hypothetical protein